MRDDDGDAACQHSVIFGRPDLPFEINLLGALHPDMRVQVFVCGNGMVVDTCHAAVDVCNARDPNSSKGNPRFSFRYERFGNE